MDMKKLVCFLLIFILMIPVLALEDSDITDFELEDTWEPDDTLRDALAELYFGADAEAASVEVPAPNVALIELETGKILYSKGADDKLRPASVTKIMTLLLTIEAIEDGRLSFDQKVTVSRAAMSMGGSTAFLHEGEQYTVSEMMKAVAVQSANDGSVVLAEAVAGTESTFVDMMNERAQALGMVNTHFMNCHGLDHDEHYTTANDVAIMSRALLRHEKIKEFTTIWMDSLRGGTFTLSNTNKLVRFYEGCTGLKTGTTSLAGSCIAASAKRGDMELIAVIMHAKSSDERYESARALLDYGFANFATMAVWPDDVLLPIPVILGRETEVQPVLERENKIVYEKIKSGLLVKTVTLCEDVSAPVVKGQKLGEITISCEDEVLSSVPIIAADTVEKLTWWDIFSKMMGMLFMKR